MSVKAVGIGSQVSAVGGVKPTDGAGQVAGAQAAAGAHGAQGPAVVEAAVRDVAARVRAGELSRGLHAVEAVIEQVVRAQAPAGLPAQVVAQRVEEMQLALAGEPRFSAQVETMLREALSA